MLKKLSQKTPKKTLEERMEDSLYMEINDEVRHEKNMAFFKKWSKLFVAVASIILIFVIISQISKNYRANKTLKEAKIYQNIMSSSTTQAQELAALLDLAKDGSYGYKTVALFKASDILIAQGKKDDAIALLQDGVKSTSNSELKAITIMKLAFLTADKLNVADAKKLLKPVLSSSSALYYSAQNLLGVICVNNSDDKCAKESFGKVANDDKAPDDIRTFAINALNSIK